MKKVQLPVSKSLYIRKLIYDFLYSDCIGAIPADAPEDVRVVHHCLTNVSKANFCDDESAKPQRIDVRDCGAAYRFLMAVLAVTPGQWLLTGTPRLLQRPIDELVQVLREMGAEIQWCSCRDARPCVSTNEYCGCWQIQGKHLHASELTIDCTRSGQFASALWLISEKIGLKKLHVLPENSSSATYIAMTEAIMEGKADMDAKRLGDWSAAVYWYALFLLSQIHEDELLAKGMPIDIHLFNQKSDPILIDKNVPSSYKLLHLDLASIQSDAALACWFADWGVDSRQEEDGVLVSYNKDLDKSQKVIELDMSQNLDLVPVLACMACLWPKTMIFNGVANLKYKESNRLQIIQEQLSSFSKIEIKSYNGILDNQLIICPIDTHNSYYIPSREFSFNACNDHRFVMGFSLFALRGKVQIKDFYCVRKSYPDFKAEGVVAGTDMLG